MQCVLFRWRIKRMEISMFEKSDWSALPPPEVPEFVKRPGTTRTAVS